jgi:hypothetical protein
MAVYRILAPLQWKVPDILSTGRKWDIPGQMGDILQQTEDILEQKGDILK